ncbi:MAG: hypothetical protein IKE23_07030 [Exiguobacterium sp.]|nr:hypothetical protein [Exiguobacterium sp.]
MAEEQLRLDVDGYDEVTKALSDLLNECPLIDENVRFNVLYDDGGIAFFPVTGAVIERERKDVLGGVEQWCSYPFIIVDREFSLDEDRRVAVKEWLDSIGRYLEKQTVDGAVLSAYPTLTGNRYFTEIRRTSPSSQMDINQDGSEDWSISMVARYRNSY